MRTAVLTFAAAALAAALGAAASAQEADRELEFEPPSEPFIMDAPPVPMERRDFQNNAPVIEIQEDGTIAPQARSGPQAGDIVREVPKVWLNGARVAAEDTEHVARFYESAFGLWEVQRIAIPGGPPEIMLNFGDSAEDAAANTAGDIVIYPREGGPPEGDDVAHLVFNVSDVEAVVREAVHYGAEVVIPPMEFGDSGIFIAYVADPEGNQIELLQGAAR